MTALDLRQVRAIEAQNRKLKARVEELEFEVRMLSGLGSIDIEEDEMPGIEPERFTVTQMRILHTLYARHPHAVLHDQIWGALYNHKPEHKQPKSKVISAFICQLRASLKGTAWEIATVVGAGYVLREVKR